MSTGTLHDGAAVETPRSSRPPEGPEGASDLAWVAVMSGPLAKEPMTDDEQRAFDAFWASRA